MLLTRNARRLGSSATNLAKALRTNPENVNLETAVGTVRTISQLTVASQEHSSRPAGLRRRNTFSNHDSLQESRRQMSTRSPFPRDDFSEKKSSTTRKGGSEYASVPLAYVSYEKKSNPEKEAKHAVVKSPLVIQHGLFGCKENWTKCGKEINFISKRRVFAVDARNHGESPHSAVMSLGLMAKDIGYFCKQQQMHKISFMGHSFGGRIGMMLAMMYPQTLDKLICVDTTPIMKQDSALRYSQVRKAAAVLKSIEPELRELQGFNRSLVAEKAISHILKDKRDIAVVLSNLIATSSSLTKRKDVTTNGVKNDPNSIWKVNLDSIMANPCLSDFPDFDKSMAYNGKTLFIQGTKSQYIKPGDEEKIKIIFPNAQFIWLEDCGHWLHLEKHTEFMQTVVQFLEDKKKPSKS